MRFYVTVTLICVMHGRRAAQDHLATLGISEGRAKEAVFNSFMSDASSRQAAAFTAMPPGARRARQLRADTRAHLVESDDFKRATRIIARPTARAAARGSDRRRDFAKQRAGFENQVAEMRKLFDQITPSSAPRSKRARSRCAISSTRWKRAAPHADRSALNKQRAAQVASATRR